MAYGLKASSCNPLRQEYYVVIGVIILNRGPVDFGVPVT